MRSKTQVPTTSQVPSIRAPILALTALVLFILALSAFSQWTTTLGSAWTAVQTWLVEQLLLGARELDPPPLVDLTAVAPQPR